MSSHTDEMHAQLMELLEEVDHLKEERDQLRQELQDNLADTQFLQDEMDDLQMTLDINKKLVSDQASTIENIQNENQQLKQQLKNSLKQHNLNDEIQSLLVAADINKKLIAEQEHTIQTLNEENKQLMNQLKNNKPENNNNNNLSAIENQALKDQIEEIKAEKDAQIQALEKLIIDLQDANDELNEMKLSASSHSPIKKTAAAPVIPLTPAIDQSTSELLMQLQAKDEALRRMSRKLEILRMESMSKDPSEYIKREAELKIAMERWEAEAMAKASENKHLEECIKEESHKRKHAEATVSRLMESARETAAISQKRYDKLVEERAALIEMISNSQEAIQTVQKVAFEHERQSRYAVDRMAKRVLRLRKILVEEMGSDERAFISDDEEEGKGLEEVGMEYRGGGRLGDVFSEAQNRLAGQLTQLAGIVAESAGEGVRRPEEPSPVLEMTDTATTVRETEDFL